MIKTQEKARASLLYSLLLEDTTLPTHNWLWEWVSSFGVEQIEDSDLC